MNLHHYSAAYQIVSLVWYAENWDANIFCQERAQLFCLSGYLHDQVELTETGRALTENTPRATQSPRARPAEKRAAAALRNHQVSQAPHLEPPAHQPNHRAPQPHPKRETMPVGRSSAGGIVALNLLQCCSCSLWSCQTEVCVCFLHESVQHMQEAAELHKENIKLKQRCNVLETEIRALRYDLTTMQRHLHLPVTISAMGVEEDSTNIRRKKTQVAVSILPMVTPTFPRLLD